MSRFISRLDFTKTIPSEFRKLDTLARFFEGTHTCVAVVKFDNKLFVSSNKLTYDDKKSCKASTNLLENINAFSIIASLEADCGDKIYDRLFVPYSVKPEKYNSEPYGQKVNKNHIYLNAWVSNLGDMDSALKEQAKLAVQDLLKPFDSRDSYRSAVSFLCSHINTNTLKGLSSRETDFLTKHATLLQKIHTRITQDEKKIKQLMCLEQFEDLKECLIKGRVELVHSTRPCENVDEKQKIKKSPHAEMNIVEYFVDNDLTTEFYLGISKLSCFGCHIDLKEFESITYRGTHAVDYETSRMASKWTVQNSKKHEFVGIEQQRGEIFLAADLSDSDGEDEPSLTGVSTDLVDVC